MPLFPAEGASWIPAPCSERCVENQPEDDDAFHKENLSQVSVEPGNSLCEALGGGKGGWRRSLVQRVAGQASRLADNHRSATLRELHVLKPHFVPAEKS